MSKTNETVTGEQTEEVRDVNPRFQRIKELSAQCDELLEAAREVEAHSHSVIAQNGYMVDAEAMDKLCIAIGHFAELQKREQTK